MTEKKNTKPGKVWLVGAGPSDPGLFTLRGRRVLKEADVVVYDALIGQGVLSMIPERARRIYVGKRSGSHAMSQDEVSGLLLDLALDGKQVVRLKGGDPFLFGRGGEEIALLAENGIPFEVVPGITSAIAVPAYQGIPVTHRDFSSSVHIITGHHREDTDSEIDYEALVRFGGTLIFLMGVAALGEICRGLLEAGMDPGMPAALLIRGTTAHQRRIVATVSTLEDEVHRQGADTPAVIVVGAVCALADDFSWYDDLPLCGEKLLVTRPSETAFGTAEKLGELGAEAVVLPMIRTVPRQDNEALRKALRNLPHYQWLVFTSPTGVRIFFEELCAMQMDVRSLHDLRIAVIGPGTAEELVRHGLYADLMPAVYDTAHLGDALAAEAEPGSCILLPRAANGSRVLTERLADMTVDEIPIYDTLPAPVEDLEVYRCELENGDIDAVMFTSSSCVKGFAHSFAGMDFSKVRAVCIGEVTKREADRLGMRTFLAEEATVDSMIECLIRKRRTKEWT